VATKLCFVKVTVHALYPVLSATYDGHFNVDCQIQKSLQ